jgi:hypothetical protein
MYKALLPYRTVRLMNRLGTLTTEQIRPVEKGVCSWLGIKVAA